MEFGSVAHPDWLICYGCRNMSTHLLVVFLHMHLEFGQAWLLSDTPDVLKFHLPLLEERELEFGFELGFQLGMQWLTGFELFVELLELFLLALALCLLPLDFLNLFQGSLLNLLFLLLLQQSLLLLSLLLFSPFQLFNCHLLTPQLLFDGSVFLVQFAHVLTHFERFTMILRPVVEIGTYRVLLPLVDLIGHHILQWHLRLFRRLYGFYWLRQHDLSFEYGLSNVVKPTCRDLCHDGQTVLTHLSQGILLEKLRLVCRKLFIDKSLNLLNEAFNNLSYSKFYLFDLLCVFVLRKLQIEQFLNHSDCHYITEARLYKHQTFIGKQEPDESTMKFTSHCTHSPAFQDMHFYSLYLYIKLEDWQQLYPSIVSPGQHWIHFWEPYELYYLQPGCLYTHLPSLFWAYMVQATHILVFQSQNQQRFCFFLTTQNPYWLVAPGGHVLQIPFEAQIKHSVRTGQHASGLKMQFQLSVSLNRHWSFYMVAPSQHSSQVPLALIVLHMSNFDKIYGFANFQNFQFGPNTFSFLSQSLSFSLQPYLHLRQSLRKLSTKVSQFGLRANLIYFGSLLNLFIRPPQARCDGDSIPFSRLVKHWLFFNTQFWRHLWHTCVAASNNQQLAMSSSYLLVKTLQSGLIPFDPMASEPQSGLSDGGRNFIPRAAWLSNITKTKVNIKTNYSRVTQTASHFILRFGLLVKPTEVEDNGGEVLLCVQRQFQHVLEDFGILVQPATLQCFQGLAADFVQNFIPLVAFHLLQVLNDIDSLLLVNV